MTSFLELLRSSAYPENSWRVEELAQYPERWWDSLEKLVGSGSSGGVYDVKSYGGAAGDGVTDDTLAFMVCIAAAIAYGRGVVYVPPGEYVISERLVVNASMIAILGDGFGVSVIKAATGSALESIMHIGVTDLSDTVVSYVHVEGITFDANNQSQHCLYLTDVSRATIDRCSFENALSHGLHSGTFNTLSNSTNNDRIWLTRCLALGNNGDGFRPEAWRESFFTDNYASGNTLDGFNFAPYIEGSATALHGVTPHCTSKGNISQNNGGHGFVFDAATRFSHTGFLAESNTGAGISFQSSYEPNNGAPGPNRVLIGDGVLRHNAGGGIIQSADSWVDYPQIDNVSIEGDLTELDAHGIYLLGARRVKITNCQIFAMAGCGIWIGNGVYPNAGVWSSIEAGDIQIIGTNILQCGAAGSAVADGIRLDDSCYDVTIAVCEFSNAMTKAVVDGGLDARELRVAAGCLDIKVLGCNFNPAGGIDYAISASSGAEDEVLLDEATRLGPNNYIPTVALASGAQDLVLPPGRTFYLDSSAGAATINTIQAMPSGADIKLINSNDNAVTIKHNTAGSYGRVYHASNADVAVGTNRMIRLTPRGTSFYSEQ